MQELSWSLHRSFGDLFAAFGDASALAIDIPIGLHEDDSPRRCDLLARKSLGSPRSSSVFPTPPRSLLADASCLPSSDRLYKRIRELAEMRGWKKPSVQAFNIWPKILEVDLAMTPALQQQVFEIHPELCFWALNGHRPMRYSKHTPEGLAERMQVLESKGLNVERALWQFNNHSMGHRDRYSRDDALDSAAAAWTACRIADGLAQRLPLVTPELDSRGLRMEMNY